MSQPIMMKQSAMSKETPDTRDVWTSLFVSNIPSDVFNIQLNEDKFRFQHYVENAMQIGKVKRIDYIVKEARGHAFVHFDHWYVSEANTDFRNRIETDGVCKVGGKLFDFECPLLSITMKRRYLTFKQNNNVLVEQKDELETLNVLQLAQLVRQLTTENVTLKSKISDLTGENVMSPEPPILQ